MSATINDCKESHLVSWDSGIQAALGKRRRIHEEKGPENDGEESCAKQARESRSYTH